MDKVLGRREQDGGLGTKPWPREPCACGRAEVPPLLILHLEVPRGEKRMVGVSCF